MSDIQFNRDFSATPEIPERISGLVRRVLCDNPGSFTFKGTSTFIVGRGEVAVIDPGPENESHLSALLAALEGETISHIFVTHRHLDHAPLARRLGKLVDAPTLAFGGSERASRGDGAGL